MSQAICCSCGSRQDEVRITLLGRDIGWSPGRVEWDSEAVIQVLNEWADARCRELHPPRVSWWRRWRHE